MPGIVFGRIQQRLAGQGDVDHPLETALRINDRQHGGVRVGHHRGQFAQRGVDLHLRILVADQVLHVHERQDGLVVVVREQVATLRDTFRINGIFLEEADGTERHGRSQDQRDQQLVAAGNLGDEEDGRHRRLHHAGHQRRHAHEGEILLRHAETQVVETTSEDETEDGAHEQRRTEGTADAPAGVGRRHREHLQEEDQREEHRHAPLRVQ